MKQTIVRQKKKCLRLLKAYIHFYPFKVKSFMYIAVFKTSMHCANDGVTKKRSGLVLFLLASMELAFFFFPQSNTIDNLSGLEGRLKRFSKGFLNSIRRHP